MLNEYEEHLTLTLRQVFYRLVAAYGYEKTERAYQNLTAASCSTHRIKKKPRTGGGAFLRKTGG